MSEEVHPTDELCPECTAEPVLEREDGGLKFYRCPRCEEKWVRGLQKKMEVHAPYPLIWKYPDGTCQLVIRDTNHDVIMASDVFGADSGAMYTWQIVVQAIEFWSTHKSDLGVYVESTAPNGLDTQESNGEGEGKPE